MAHRATSSIAPSHRWTLSACTLSDAAEGENRARD